MTKKIPPRIPRNEFDGRLYPSLRNKRKKNMEKCTCIASALLLSAGAKFRRPEISIRSDLMANPSNPLRASRSVNGNNIIRADASHAWLSVCIPESGWVDVDPTNNLIPEDKHITLAWGRNYSDVTPVKGNRHGRRFPQPVDPGGCNGAKRILNPFRACYPIPPRAVLGKNHISMGQNIRAI